MGLGGLEPPTSRLSGVRSNQLSYRPKQMTEDRGQKTVLFLADANCSDFLASCLCLPRFNCHSKDQKNPYRHEVGKGQGDPSKLNNNANGVNPHCRPKSAFFLKKEVIQPQVPLGLPCYDFTPVTRHTLAACLRKRLAQLLLVQPTPVV